MKPKHSLLKSFGFASQGFKTAFVTGRNFRIQIGLGTLAIILATIFRISSGEWVLLFLIIGMVLVLELLNTAIETIVDMISPEVSDSAKLVKDIAAAAVMVAAVTSVLIGIFIFLPKILN